MNQNFSILTLQCIAFLSKQEINTSTIKFQENPQNKSNSKTPYFSYS